MDQLKAALGDEKASYKCSQNIFRCAMLFNADPTALGLTQLVQTLNVLMRCPCAANR